MSATAEVQSGLEGVVAFATEIAEPDREGGALRYRGVDIEELVGNVPFEQVWGLLVDGTLQPGLPPAEPHPLSVRSGDPRVDVQSALAMLAPQWGFGQLIDISDEEARDNLARASVMALSFVAQSARGIGKPPVPQREIDKAKSIPERFLIRWRGEANPDHVKAIDAYWNSAAEHGMNASTFTARVVASTGADVAAALSAAVGALSGPLHGGAPSRVLKMLDDVAEFGDAEQYVKDVLDSGQRLMGFGHRVYRAEDPRARVLRRTAHEIDAPRVEVAEALEKAALAELQARRPDRVLATNVEFWSAVVLDFAEVPPELFTPMFTCARTAGWSAHIMEQKREGKLIRPTAKYVGPRRGRCRTCAERIELEVGPASGRGPGTDPHVLREHPGGAEPRPQRAQRGRASAPSSAAAARLVTVVERGHDLARRAGGETRRRRARPGRGGRIDLAGDRPAVGAVVGLGPPAVEHAELQAAVEGRLHAARAAGLQRRPRQVQPHVAAAHQPGRRVEVVVVEEHHPLADDLGRLEPEQALQRRAWPPRRADGPCRPGPPAPAGRRPAARASSPGRGSAGPAACRWPPGGRTRASATSGSNARAAAST